MAQQVAADPAALVSGLNVGVPHERHVVDVLDAHHADQTAAVKRAPEAHAGGDLATQLVGRHVGLVVAVGGNDAGVGGRGRVHNRDHRVEVGS